jgi:hypothetical protein
VVVHHILAVEVGIDLVVVHHILAVEVGIDLVVVHHILAVEVGIDQVVEHHSLAPAVDIQLKGTVVAEASRSLEVGPGVGRQLADRSLDPVVDRLDRQAIGLDNPVLAEHTDPVEVGNVAAGHNRVAATLECPYPSHHNGVRRLFPRLPLPRRILLLLRCLLLRFFSTRGSIIRRSSNKRQLFLQ